MLKGEVIWFSGPKSYGFISQDNGGPDIFCHFSSIEGISGYRTLQQGQRVEYDIETGPKQKPQASHVRVIVED